MDCSKMHAPDNRDSTFEELEDMAQSRRFWRSLVVKNEPEDTLELQKRKKVRKTRSSGTTTLDLDASQWLKRVNKQVKFDGGLIAKLQRQLRRADDCVAITLYFFFVLVFIQSVVRIISQWRWLVLLN